MTRAERIAEIIGYDNFLRAEAYYYNFYTPTEVNFVDSLNYSKNIGSAFAWCDTEEGYNFWNNLYVKILEDL